MNFSLENFNKKRLYLLPGQLNIKYILNMPRLYSQANDILKFNHIFARAVIISVICLFILYSCNAFAENTICANVNIEIKQELTLERQAFDAHMKISNGLQGANLDNIKIEVLFTDKDNKPVLASNDPDNINAKFFITIDSLSNITKIDGSDFILPQTTADIHWLIIPAPGAANENPQGSLYYVGASLSYKIGNEQFNMNVVPDYIYVKPMPNLILDYFLPYDVFGDDPLTSEIEPIIPFALGVRVKNSGFGTARNVNIESAQPKIIDNDQKLLVNFLITGSEVQGIQGSDSLLVNFGNIEPAYSKIARWTMTSTLLGRFVDFTAQYTHADELGGKLTSLIQNVNTHTLIQNVLVDLSGRDQIKDFLAKNQNGQAVTYAVYESESIDSPVNNKSASSSFGTPAQTGNDFSHTLTTTTDTGFVYIQLPDPYNGTKIIKSVTRSDGKVLNTANVWLSQTRPNPPTWDYYFNLFDSNPIAFYTVVFSSPETTTGAPVLQFIEDKKSAETEKLSFTVSASDPDGDNLILSVQNLPVGANFIDNGNGLASFDWTPLEGQSGSYQIKFTASDGKLFDTQVLVIRINPAWDKDGDGMDDNWETTHFGTLDKDGLEDSDGDGISDLDEFKNQTDPMAGGAPSVAEIESPALGEEVAILQPVLTVKNSIDPDGDVVKYEFQVFDTEQIDTPVASEIISETDTSTSWTVPVELTENKTYWWRVRATDGFAYSQWAYGKFIVNSQNEAPSKPYASIPYDSNKVNSIYPLLKFTNSVDPDNDSISYEVQLSFDIPISLFDPNAKISFSSGSIKQGDMETFWKVNIPLTENTCYDWKIIATDEHGLKTESDINSFYVNLSNNAPLCPELKAPVFNSEIQVQSVNLIVENVPNPDTDNDTVYYNFEIDISRNFDSPDKIVSGLLSEGTDGFTSWSVSNLSDNQKYFWRAKATDVSTDSEWVYGEFIVNLENDVPSIPTFKNPGNLSQVETLIPILEANPSLDVDKDVLSYQFEIYDDKSLNNRIEFGNSNFPSYQLNQTLNDKTFYYWRVKTVDAHGFESNWSAVGRFFVKDNLINDPPQIKILEPSKDIITNKNTFDITWEDLDMDSNATVTLYYTQTKWQAGVIITSGIEEDADGENDCFNWDISAVGDGSYYVYVEISDGNETVTSYSQNVLTVDKAKPVVSAFPPGGIYIANQNVQLSVNETAEIYYTTDGSEPNLTSVRYSNPIEISDLTTLKFIARDSAGNLSTVKTEDYIVGAKTNVQLSDVPDWTPNISPSWTWTEPSGLPNFEGYAICLDSEPEVFTTETSYTAPPLSEGNHTFSVKVKYAGIFGEISTDEFGIDTTPPLLESVVINNGEAGTTDRSITLNINHNNDGVAGSGIQSTLVKIDNGEFTDLTGNTLTLPETIGLHTVSVKLIDNVGLESEIKSDNIILASVLNKISGTSSNGDKAILTDLMSNFKVTANIINNGFIFENIPEGLYGLVVENANSIAAYKGRISLFGSSNFNAGEITISNELGGITGIVTQNDLPQTDMDVSLCVNLGQGYFLPIKKAVSDIYGSYDMQNIPAGLYCLKSQNKNLSFIESNPLQVVKINALETINAEIIIGGVNLSGVVNTSEIILKVFNEQLLSWETLTNTDSYSLGLPNGNYTLIAKSIYKYLEPLLFSIEGLPVTKNLNFIDKQFSILGSVLNAETIIVDNDEPFLRKSLQLYSNNNRYILPVSNEITSSGLIKTYDDSVNNENWILCLIADDFGKDIHSINLVPASITAQAYSIVNAGGKISGIITYKGEPYQKPIALLYNSSDELIGRCEGSFYGEYFFKNVPPASDYKIKATLFGVEETFEVNSIELLEGENKTNVNLNIGDNTPPVIVAQSNIIAEVISKTGTPVNIPVTASDDYDANPEIVINGPALFPLGNTSVQITAKDNSGNESTKTITVTVKDTTKPVFTSFPPDRAVESVGTKTIVELKTPLASDIFNVTITNDAPIDGFSAGVTIVTWMAKDENENYITAQQKIKVCDTSLVGNLQNNSTNPYSKTISDNNIAPYTDRTYVIKSLPDILIGSVLIKTPNSDKSSQQADILKITPSNDAEVYIAYDLRALAIGKPAFLSLYYDETTLNIEVKETGDYVNCLRLFKKKVNVLSGETVSFSGNQYGYSNYLIFLKESQPASGQTNLSKINFTRSGYLLDSFNPASSPYTDRLNYTFYQYPGFLENSQIIRTPNNDKSIANANIIDMTFSNQCYVYVAYDIRNVLLNNIPAFLTGFEDMGVDVKVTEGSYGINTLRLFRKEFNANVQMFLSGNQYGNSNYFVFIKSSKSLPLITSFFSRNDQQYKVKALSDVIEAYSDRTHTLNHSSLPVYLKDALYIQTPNSDKYINQTEMVMSFTAGMQPINVYVAYDKKLYETGCTPLFLNAFELLPEGITIVEGAYGINDLILFCSTVQPNQTIELYGNNGNAESNYVVFVTKS